MREMKDSGIEWIGEIPREWNTIILSSLFRERKCKNRGMVETNLLSLSYGNIKKKDITTNEGLLPDSFETYNVINEGNIVFRLTDLQNDKRSLRTGLCKERGIITSAYITLELIQNDVSAYMHYLFHTYDLCKVFYGMGDGVRQGANFEDLKKLKIIRPPLSDQQKISAYLGTKCTKIDSIIEKQEKVIEKLKEYKLSVITEAVTKGLNPDVKMKDSGIEWIGEIPENWEYAKLNNICTFHNGDRSSNYPSPSDFVDEGIPFIGADSLNNHFVDISICKYITYSKYNAMSGLKVEKNDILYTLRGSTIGKNALCNFNDATVASSLMGIRISLENKCFSNFLSYWLNSDSEYIQRDICINGSTAPNLSAENVKSFIIFLPPIEEQHKIANYLDKKCSAIDKSIEQKQAIIEKLKEYKKSLIYEVVTGKRGV